MGGDQSHMADVDIIAGPTNTPKLGADMNTTVAIELRNQLKRNWQKVFDRTNRKNKVAPLGTRWNDLARRYINIEPTSSTGENLFGLDNNGIPIINEENARSIRDIPNDKNLGFPQNTAQGFNIPNNNSNNAKEWIEIPSSVNNNLTWYEKVSPVSLFFRKRETRKFMPPTGERNAEGIETAYRNLPVGWIDQRLIPVHPNFTFRNGVYPNETGALRGLNNRRFTDPSFGERYWSNGIVFWATPAGQRALYRTSRRLFDEQIKLRENNWNKTRRKQVIKAFDRIDRTERLFNAQQRLEELEFENRINEINRRFN
jgi:hypothetical protein